MVEALLNETERVSILHKVLAFMREVLARGQFAHPSGDPTSLYQRPRPSQPLDAQDEPGPSQWYRGDEKAELSQAAPARGCWRGQGRGRG